MVQARKLRYVRGRWVKKLFSTFIGHFLIGVYLCK